MECLYYTIVGIKKKTPKEDFLAMKKKIFELSHKRHEFGIRFQTPDIAYDDIRYFTFYETIQELETSWVDYLFSEQRSWIIHSKKYWREKLHSLWPEYATHYFDPKQEFFAFRLNTLRHILSLYNKQQNTENNPWFPSPLSENVFTNASQCVKPLSEIMVSLYEKDDGLRTSSLYNFLFFDMMQEWMTQNMQ
jgi:hypothetical protein